MMNKNGTDIQFAICGSAGDGTIASGDIVKRAAAAVGFHVIAFDVYPPEIRGFGKCISRIRVSSEQAYSLNTITFDACLMAVHYPQDFSGIHDITGYYVYIRFKIVHIFEHMFTYLNGCMLLKVGDKLWLRLRSRIMKR